MASITDNPPNEVQADLDSLCADLDSKIPPKRERSDKNLLIATWNIRCFGSLTRKWTAESEDSPKRDLRGLRAICEILSRFDVVAIQEITGDLRSLRDMVVFLGKNWAFLMTDITLGKAGNKERMAFIFDRRRVQPSGLACELVVPPEWLGEIGKDALSSQFARTPYAVSFKAQNTTFILVTLHVLFGEDSTGRKTELKAIARWMAEWATRTTNWHQNFIVLGDFNIDRYEDELWQAFTSTGLKAPSELNKVPRTIFHEEGKPETNRFYDQIAWFIDEKSEIPRLSMNYLKAGFFNFLPHVYTDRDFNKVSISWRVSDHYPLWTEFKL